MSPAQQSSAGLLPSQGRRLTFSGFTAVGILKTLHPKRENGTARGPFPGKGLPTGLGLADGN